MARTYVDEMTIKWSENTNSPLVLLFGWAGCRDRYLAKYSEIYEKLGCSIVRYTVPVEHVNDYTSFRQFALEIYERVLDVENNELQFPIMFHIFSMNGFSLFSALWQLLDITSNGSAVKQMVKGIIFDSCPANVRPWQKAEAISVATMPSNKYNMISRGTYRIFLTGKYSLDRAFIWLRSNFEPNVYEQNFPYFNLLKMPDLPKLQLYLYSQADSICSAKSIEEFQVAQLDRCCVVRSKCWVDSQHVEHFREHSEEYTQLCIDFVNEFNS
ncbi:transmembrane protein 53-B [Ditylenchus destructor]|uniref:Transmembrane protein 53-B n=1 Tax=Ditylenchus destructor TaxID=166010 RepID=A0AAD4MYR4_9BILA|nr:transmembrane protein 53-B [Ditylenchus destructor]